MKQKADPSVLHRWLYSLPISFHNPYVWMFMLLISTLFMLISFSLALYLVVEYFDPSNKYFDHIQPISAKSISKELGGLAYTSSCFVPNVYSDKNLCAPQFIIAGTMKGGTTSLFTYLEHHPLVLPLVASNVTLPKTEQGQQSQIRAMGDKEIRFFNRKPFEALTKDYSESVAFEHYLKFFPEISRFNESEYSTKDGYITGEASPTYMYELGVAERIHKFLPAVKLLFLLRDPIDRAYSEYWFRQGYTVGQSKKLLFKYNRLGLSDEEIFMQCIKQDFAILDYCDVPSWDIKKPWKISPMGKCYSETVKILQREQDGRETIQEPIHCGNKESPLNEYCLDSDFYYYCNTKSAFLGLYAIQLKDWRDTFSSDMMLLIESEELFQYPADVLRRIEKFLKIDHVEFDWDEVTKNIYNMATTTNVHAEDIVSNVQKAEAFVLANTGASSYPPLSQESIEFLQTKFLFYNRRLETMTHRKFPFWKYDVNASFDLTVFKKH